MPVAVGVDACKGGWVAIAVDDGGVLTAGFVAQIASLSSVVPGADIVGIDIPIGLPSRAIAKPTSQRGRTARRSA